MECTDASCRWSERQTAKNLVFPVKPLSPIQAIDTEGEQSHRRVSLVQNAFVALAASNAEFAALSPLLPPSSERRQFSSSSPLRQSPHVDSDAIRSRPLSPLVVMESPPALRPTSASSSCRATTRRVVPAPDTASWRWHKDPYIAHTVVAFCSTFDICSHLRRLSRSFSLAAGAVLSLGPRLVAIHRGSCRVPHRPLTSLPPDAFVHQSTRCLLVEYTDGVALCLPSQRSAMWLELPLLPGGLVRATVIGERLCRRLAPLWGTGSIGVVTSISGNFVFVGDAATQGTEALLKQCGVLLLEQSDPATGPSSMAAVARPVDHVAQHIAAPHFHIHAIAMHSGEILLQTGAHIAFGEGLPLVTATPLRTVLGLTSRSASLRPTWVEAIARVMVDRSVVHAAFRVRVPRLFAAKGSRAVVLGHTAVATVDFSCTALTSLPVIPPSRLVVPRLCVFIDGWLSPAVVLSDVPVECDLASLRSRLCDGVPPGRLPASFTFRVFRGRDYSDAKMRPPGDGRPMPEHAALNHNAIAAVRETETFVRDCLPPNRSQFLHLTLSAVGCGGWPAVCTSQDGFAHAILLLVSPVLNSNLKTADRTSTPVGLTMSPSIHPSPTSSFAAASSNSAAATLASSVYPLLTAMGTAWDACISGDVQRLALAIEGKIPLVLRAPSHSAAAQTFPPSRVSAKSVLLEELGQVQHCPRVNLRCGGAINITALHLACEYGHAAVVDLLLLKGAPVLHKDVSGATPLHAAARRGHADCIPALLKAAPDALNVADHRGRTALHVALYNGFVNTALWLVEAGAAVDLIDHNGFCAADLAVPRLPDITDAVRTDNIDLCRRMVKCAMGLTIPPSVTEATKTHCDESLFGGPSLADHSHENLHEWYLEQLRHRLTEGRLVYDLVGDVTLCPHTGRVIPNILKWTALHSAVEARATKCIAALLQCPLVHINAQSAAGDTALHRAASIGDATIVTMLLRRGDVNPSLVNFRGETPLIVALRRKRLHVVELLIERTQLSPLAMRQRDTYGLSACHYAIGTMTDIDVPQRILSAALTDFEKHVDLYRAEEEGRLSGSDPLDIPDLNDQRQNMTKSLDLALARASEPQLFAAPSELQERFVRRFPRKLQHSISPILPRNAVSPASVASSALSPSLFDVVVTVGSVEMLAFLAQLAKRNAAKNRWPTEDFGSLSSGASLLLLRAFHTRRMNVYSALIDQGLSPAAVQVPFRQHQISLPTYILLHATTPDWVAEAVNAPYLRLLSPSCFQPCDDDEHDDSPFMPACSDTVPLRSSPTQNAPVEQNRVDTFDLIPFLAREVRASLRREERIHHMERVSNLRQAADTRSSRGTSHRNTSRSPTPSPSRHSKLKTAVTDLTESTHSLNAITVEPPPIVGALSPQSRRGSRSGTPRTQQERLSQASTSSVPDSLCSSSIQLYAFGTLITSLAAAPDVCIHRLRSTCVTALLAARDAVPIRTALASYIIPLSPQLHTMSYQELIVAVGGAVPLHFTALAARHTGVVIATTATPSRRNRPEKSPSNTVSFSGSSTTRRLSLTASSQPVDGDHLPFVASSDRYANIESNLCLALRHTLVNQGPHCLLHDLCRTGNIHAALELVTGSTGFHIASSHRGGGDTSLTWRDPEREAKYGVDALQLAAQMPGALPLVKALIGTGYFHPTRGCGPLGWTTVHYAAKAASPVVLKWLLAATGRRGATVRAFPSQETPLHAAAAAGRIEHIHLILATIGTPLVRERFQMPNSAVDARDRYGSTPLALACRYGHEAVVAALTQAGALLDSVDRRGDTPALCAARAGHESLLLRLPLSGDNGKWLLAANRHTGTTVLHLAAWRGLAGVVDFFVSRAASAISSQAPHEKKQPDKRRGSVATAASVIPQKERNSVERGHAELISTPANQTKAPRLSVQRLRAPDDCPALRSWFSGCVRSGSHLSSHYPRLCEALGIENGGEVQASSIIDWSRTRRSGPLAVDELRGRVSELWDYTPAEAPVDANPQPQLKAHALGISLLVDALGAAPRSTPSLHVATTESGQRGQSTLLRTAAKRLAEQVDIYRVHMNDYGALPTLAAAVTRWGASCKVARETAHDAKSASFASVLHSVDRAAQRQLETVDRIPALSSSHMNHLMWLPLHYAEANASAGMVAALRSAMGSNTSLPNVALQMCSDSPTSAADSVPYTLEDDLDQTINSPPMDLHGFAVPPPSSHEVPLAVSQRYEEVRHILFPPPPPPTPPVQQWWSRHYEDLRAHFAAATNPGGWRFDSSADLQASRIEQVIKWLCAKRFSSVQMISDYLTFYGDVNRPLDRHGFTVLHWAAFFGATSVVEILLSRGAATDASACLHLEGGASLGTTPLHLAADHGHRLTASMLLQAGANPNKQDECGNTSLHLACARKNVQMQQILLHHDATITIQNFKGETAEDVAIMLRHSDGMRLLRWWRIADCVDPRLDSSSGASYSSVARRARSPSPPRGDGKILSPKALQLSLIPRGGVRPGGNIYSVPPCQAAVEYDVWLRATEVYYARLDRLHQPQVAMSNEGSEERSVPCLLYARVCKLLHSSPMRSVMNQLRPSWWPEEVVRIDMSGTYLGDAGMATLLSSLRLFPRLELLDLAGTEMTVDGVALLCDCVVDHPGLRRISLCGNKAIGRASSMRILELLDLNRHIVSLDVSFTTIDESVQDQIAVLTYRNMQEQGLAFAESSRHVNQTTLAREAAHRRALRKERELRRAAASSAADAQTTSNR